MYRRPYEQYHSSHYTPYQGYANYFPFQQHINTPPYKSYYNYPQHLTPFQQYAKPQQPTQWPDFMEQYSKFYPPPYPNQGTGILNHFHDENGQVDFNKMLSTVGQLANTVQQVSPVIKQVGDMIKTFR